MNLINKFWNGDITLWQSYWIFGVVIPIPVGFLLGVLAAMMGLPPISFVGHGIGLHLHEEPYLGKYTDYELQAGMVLGIEPLVYQTGHGFGMQLKDMIVIDTDGAELLSDVSNTDKLYRIG